jgi:hypothetical protein
MMNKIIQKPLPYGVGGDILHLLDEARDDNKVAARQWQKQWHSMVRAAGGNGGWQCLMVEMGIWNVVATDDKDRLKQWRWVSVFDGNNGFWWWHQWTTMRLGQRGGGKERRTQTNADATIKLRQRQQWCWRQQHQWA